MGKKILIDLFVEDHAHEEFLTPLVQRIAAEHGKIVALSVRSARGGHGRAISELELYQKAVTECIGGLAMPDLLVVGIDGNCERYQAARKTIQAKLNEAFQNRTVIACPDPHIERWFLADTNAFARVVGSSPRVRKGKCQRDYYKALLSQSVVDSGQNPTLGGIEFAREIVEAMDLYHSGKADKSLKAFLDGLSSFFQTL